MKRILKKIAKILFIMIALFLFIGLSTLATLYLTNKHVEHTASKHLYHQMKDVPHNKVGLLLGTIKMLPNGRINLYFKYRIRAAAQLYKMGKIDYILASGDNSKEEYNEPEDMFNELIRLGVPENKIYLDYAGFRTLDSVVRAKEIFGQNEFTIISQSFHNERAIYLAQYYDINAIGFNARDLSLQMGWHVQLREYLARVKAVLDLHILGKQPKYLGDQIKIG